MLGFDYSTIVPIVMIITILVCEYLINIFSPLMEKWIFVGKDRADLTSIRKFEDRFLTKKYLRKI